MNKNNSIIISGTEISYLYFVEFGYRRVFMLKIVLYYLRLSKGIQTDYDL